MCQYLYLLHVTNNYLINIVDKYIDWFKKYQPIGCRDLSSVQKLKSRNIDAIFVGCVTLTLEPSQVYNGKTYEVDCIIPDVLEKEIFHILYITIIEH